MCVPVHTQHPVNSLQANTLTAPLTFPFISQEKQKRPVTECLDRGYLKGTPLCWKSEDKTFQRFKAELRNLAARGVHLKYDVWSVVTINHLIQSRCTAAGWLITFHPRIPNVLERLEIECRWNISLDWTLLPFRMICSENKRGCV